LESGNRQIEDYSRTNANSAMELEELKGKIVIIGGAVISKEDADKIGALFGKTREDAVVLATKAIEQKRGKT
jgi:methanogenic corrinoid protein MtbC1